MFLHGPHIASFHRPGETGGAATGENLVYISRDQRPEGCKSALLIKPTVSQKIKALLDQGNDLVAADGRGTLSSASMRRTGFPKD